MEQTSVSVTSEITDGKQIGPSECVRCPDALQKGCCANVVATINGVIFSFSLTFSPTITFLPEGVVLGSKFFGVQNFLGSKKKLVKDFLGQKIVVKKCLLAKLFF